MDVEQKKKRVLAFFDVGEANQLWRSTVGISGLFSMKGCLKMCAYWSQAPTHFGTISTKGVEYLYNHPALHEHETLKEWQAKTNPQKQSK